MNEGASLGALDTVWPLVGRDELLARTITALHRPASRIVVLTGDAGAGKTRIAAAAADAATAEGGHVVTLHGHPVLTAVPLGVAGPLLPAGPSPDDAGALFEVARRHLVDQAAGRRLVLRVEAIALLDPVTVALVAQLTAARVATLLATLRTGEPLPDALAAQWSPDDCARIDVPALTPAEAGDMLQAGFGGPVAWHVTDALHAASGGNPLYLRELALGAAASGRLAAVAGTWQLTGEPVATPALRELVLAHIRRLDPAARDIVERLAVCGELAVAHLDGPGDALVALEESGVVVLAPGRDGLTARLAQAQDGAVVRDGMSVLRVAEIARIQADRLEAEGRPDDALRIALWRLDAGIPVDDATLLAAAALADRVRDHRTVARLAAASSGTDPRLLLLRGGALGRLGRLDESLAALRSAADLASDDDPALVMAIATTAAFTHASRVDGTTAALAVLDALPPELAAGPSATLMRATLAMYEHRAADARRLLDDVAPAFAGSPVERMVHAHALAAVLSAQGEDAAAIAAAHDALATAESLDPAHRPLPLATMQATCAEVLLQAGRLDDAAETALRAMRLASVAGDEFITRYVEFVLGRIALEQGRLDSAARWFREAASGALARGPESLVAPAVGGLAIIHLSRGDPDSAEQALALAPPGTPPRNPTSLLTAGIAMVRAGDLAGAAGLLRDAAREASEAGYPFLAGVYLFTLARWGGAVDAAPELARLVEVGAGEFTGLQARHARAEAEGDRAELVAVADDWESRGALLYAAEALAAAARLAQARGESRAATALQTRSDGLAARTQGAATPLLRFTAALTPLTAREREIAALAAQGTSSKEIAERLFLSVRTVDNHLQSIYGKLGIRGRRELADAIA